MTARLVPFLALALLSASQAGAQSLAFVEASSELDDGKPRSYAYNLIDGKDTTAWCSKPNPGTERLVFGFTKRATVSEFGIVVGAIQGGKIDKRRHRAAEVVVSDGQVERILPMKDEPGLQKIKLNPPAKARMLVVEIRGLHDGEAGTPLCIGEIHLKGGRVYTGKGKEVRSLPTPARRLLHSWVDDVGAPERTLIFGLDGKFRYEFTPLMEGKPRTIVGDWRAGSRTVTLEWRGKKYVMKKRLSKIDGDFGETQQMTLQGDAPHSSMNADYQIAPPQIE
jgi:hypothetical protein